MIWKIAQVLHLLMTLAMITMDCIFKMAHLSRMHPYQSCWKLFKKMTTTCAKSLLTMSTQLQQEKLSCHGTQMDLDQLLSASSKVNDGKLYGETDKMMVQAQVDEENVAFVNKVEDSIKKSDSSSCHTLQVKASGAYSGSEIKIQSRHPRNQPSSMNSDAQGIASRRIHLSIERRQNSVRYEKSNEVSNSEEKESESLVAEAAPDISLDPWELEGRITNENKETAQTCNPRLELQVKHAGKNGCAKIASFIISMVSSTDRDACYLNLHAVIIYLVLVLLIVSLSIWKPPILHELHR